MCGIQRAFSRLSFCTVIKDGLDTVLGQFYCGVEAFLNVFSATEVVKNRPQDPIQRQPDGQCQTDGFGS